MRGERAESMALGMGMIQGRGLEAPPHCATNSLLVVWNLFIICGCFEDVVVVSKRIRSFHLAESLGGDVEVALLVYPGNFDMFARQVRDKAKSGDWTVEDAPIELRDDVCPTSGKPPIAD